MKKLLLLAVAAMPFMMSAQDKVPAEVESLTQVWEVTEGLPAAGVARQGTAFDGKFYIQNREEGQILVIGANGIEKTIESAPGSHAICTDAAGNLVTRVDGVWATKLDFNLDADPAVPNLRIYPADGSEPIDVYLPATMSNGRCDYLGTASGDLMDEGYLYIVPVGCDKVICVPFVEGEMDEYGFAEYPVTGGSVSVSLSPVANAFFNSDGDEQLLFYNRSIYPMLLSWNDKGDGFDAQSIAYTDNARKDNLYGAYPFSCGGYDLMIAPLKGENQALNYSDGFRIVDMADPSTSLIDVEPTLGDAGKLNNGGVCTDWFVVEPDAEKAWATIYQYAPGNYVRVYDLRLAHDVTGIETVSNASKTVSSVKYYNVQGVESNVPFDGVNIVVNTYTDGTRQATKLIK